jgi:hypothetical protein
MEYLRLKSTLKDNLTGSQITTIFDVINNQMIYHLNMFTEVLDPNFIQLLGWVSNNRRKKVSSLPRAKQLKLLYYGAYCTNKQDKYKTFCRLKLDRSYIRRIVSNFLEAADGYTGLYQKYFQGVATDLERLRMSEIERVCTCDRNNLYGLIGNLTSLLELSQQFKEQLIAKYYKFIWTQVKKTICDTSRHFDSNCLMQNYIAAALKALDRYDSSKGALTSYIRYWILNSQQSAEESPEYGIAYYVPATQRIQKANRAESNEGVVEDNFSSSLDDILASDELTSQSLTEDSACPETLIESKSSYVSILKLSRFADPLGIARLSLGIEEFFDTGMLTQMHQYMVAKGIY